MVILNSFGQSLHYLFDKKGSLVPIKKLTITTRADTLKGCDLLYRVKNSIEDDPPIDKLLFTLPDSKSFTIDFPEKYGLPIMGYFILDSVQVTQQYFFIGEEEVNSVGNQESYFTYEVRDEE